MGMWAITISFGAGVLLGGFFGVVAVALMNAAALEDTGETWEKETTTWPDMVADMRAAKSAEPEIRAYQKPEIPGFTFFEKVQPKSAAAANLGPGRVAYFDPAGQVFKNES